MLYFYNSMIKRLASGAFIAILLALLPTLAAAQTDAAPMAVLDLQFDARRALEILRLRKQVADLHRAGVDVARAKSRNKAARIELGKKVEQARNALADLAVDYVAQMETAEALLRLDYGRALADRFRKDLSDTLWRLDQRSKAGDARASATLGSLYRLGLVAVRNEEKACDYYRQAAQKGHVAALFRAADCGDPNAEASGHMRELAAQGGHPLAQEMKGRACLRDKPDVECALSWLGRAAAQGRPSAMSLLGWMYSTGELMPRDDKRAFAYLMDAAKLGDAAAQNNVGQMYETGRGAPTDGSEAFSWYKRAAEAGLGSAQVNLARSYIEGRGTAPDKAAAAFWLEQAQKQGVVEAAKLLDWLAAH